MLNFALMESIIVATELEEGRAPEQVASRGLAYVTGVTPRRRGSHRYSQWTPEEDQFLRDNHGYMTDAEIGAFLGRTEIAVHLRWSRDLHLPSPSRHPDVITANRAARLLGLDAHKIAHWADVGLLVSRDMPGPRRIRLLHRVAFERWVVSPSSWIYFDWKKIPDRRLRRLCQLRARRWGDEWWTTVEVARYHGVDSKDVLRLITKKKNLPGVQVATSLGGRNKNPYWLNWYVKKSDALKAVFLRGKGSGHTIEFTRRAERWMLKAHKAGWSYQAITRSMGSKCDPMTISKNIRRLLEERKK